MTNLVHIGETISDGTVFQLYKPHKINHIHADGGFFKKKHKYTLIYKGEKGLVEVDIYYCGGSFHLQEEVISEEFSIKRIRDNGKYDFVDLRTAQNFFVGHIPDEFIY